MINNKLSSLPNKGKTAPFSGVDGAPDKGASMASPSPEKNKDTLINVAQNVLDILKPKEEPKETKILGLHPITFVIASLLVVGVSVFVYKKYK